MAYIHKLLAVTTHDEGTGHSWELKSIACLSRNAIKGNPTITNKWQDVTCPRCLKKYHPRKKKKPAEHKDSFIL